MSNKKPTAAKPTNDNGPAAPAPAAPVPIPTGVGLTLREARESTGQLVAQIAARLRIKPDYLQALEDENPDGLPGRVYAIGFLRSYATYLDLDPIDLIRRYKGAAESPAESPELKVLKPTPEQRQTPGAPAIAASALVVLAILAGWYYLSSANNPLTVRPVTAPENISAPAGALLPPRVTTRKVPELDVPAPPPVVAVQPEAAPQPERPEPEVAAATEPHPSEPAPAPEAERIAAAPESAALPEPPAPTTTQANGPRTFGQANRGARIQLTAKSDIWIQVRDAGGSDVFTRMLREGESYHVPNRPDLRLLTGNAGALAVTVDGNTAPPLGDFGTILRDLPLDPEGLK